MRTFHSIFPILLVAGVLSILACQRTDPEPPVNPFDAIVYQEELVPPQAPDSASLVGLHTYIFSVSCAVPGCHEGSFEPDFRTVQSTYSTLVFHPVVKNDLAGSFEQRVVPFDAAASWLYQRVTTQDPVLGRMPLYDNPLDEGQLTALKQWINAGAPDQFGQVSNQPNTQPRFLGVAAFQEFGGGIEIRVDTFRNGGEYNPFGAKANLDLTLWFLLEDDSTALPDLSQSRVQFASGVSNLFNFQSSLELSATYSAQPKVIPDYFGTGEPASFHWSVQVNTSAFPVNEFTLIRFFTNDGDHDEDFQFPRDDHPDEFKAYMGMYVVP